MITDILEEKFMAYIMKHGIEPTHLLIGSEIKNTLLLLYKGTVWSSTTGDSLEKINGCTIFIVKNVPGDYMEWAKL